MQAHSDKTQFHLRHYPGEFVEHAHDHHQLVLPVKGAMNMDIDGLENRVSSTRVAAIAAGQNHSFASRGDNAFLIIDIPAGNPIYQTGNACFWNAVGNAPFVDVDANLTGYSNFIAAETEHSNLSHTQRLLAAELLIKALSRNLGLSCETLSSPLAKAVRFIDQHFGQPITIKDISQASAMSPSRLHAQFKSHYAMSPKQYMTTLRLKHAALLLEKSNLAIAEIALKVGYCDQSAFSRAFERHMGTTPSLFRKQH